MVGLVDHQQVDAGRHRLLGQAAPRGERLQADDRAAVDVERVEARAVVARHVGQPLVVEQGEDLVVLAPQLAQPLHGQRLGRDHQRALGAAGVQQPVEDQAGLDRLAEPHLVGQQPAHGSAPAGALGGVELVGEELDAAAQERAEAVGLAQAGEAQAVEPVERSPRSRPPRPAPGARRGGSAPAAARASASGTSRPSSSRAEPSSRTAATLTISPLPRSWRGRRGRASPSCRPRSRAAPAHGRRSPAPASAGPRGTPPSAAGPRPT